MKKLLVMSMFAILPFSIITASDDMETKPADERNIRIHKGDFNLGIGGKTKIEHFFQRNVELLNSKLPNQSEYFKNTLDMIFDFNYGEKTFGHNAIQAFTNIRHKGVWGRGSVFADSDATSPVEISLSESSFGEHVHTNGKPLIWIKDAWLKFSLNAAFGKKNPEAIHYVQLGWFPFELGRGIALGPVYGLNRELLGLYSYPEDKSAPGISISGDIFKDTLSYALYYGKFEERNKSIRDTFNTVKANHIGRHATPWRGLGKDDEVVAGKLKWKALNKSKYGTLVLEPYAMYNEASDQKTERPDDTKKEIGTVGLSAEHSYKNFEYGGEVAFNFGNEILKAIDRNHAEISRNDTGNLIERYSHIVAQDPANNVNPTKALVSTTSKPQAEQLGTINSQNLVVNLWNAKDRFRPAYKNKLRGWMGVFDASYKIDTITLAAAYGYASGDDNPHTKEVNKTYKGFIGLHEIYSGKRVQSVLLLSERLLFTPSSLHTDDTQATPDFAFSDLAHVGVSATWKPNFAKSKNISINPNVMFFWKASASKKFDTSNADPAQWKASTENASKYMGAELNLFSSMEIIKNLKLFGTFATFIPGGYFSDVKGVPSSKSDIYNKLSTSAKAGTNAKDYRLGNDTAYHINVGLEYKF